MKYLELNNYFKNNEFRKIDKDENAYKFYLLRSISKAKTLKDFCEKFQLEKDLNNIFENKNITVKVLENYIENKYVDLTKEELKQIELELNKMQNFDWGGSNGNSLEKNIVNNYVKKYVKYDDIQNAIIGNIQKSVYGYTLNSWYNHWSTVMIENIFKSNKNILPTVELIEKIDFFINNVPFDLKTTYFPEELLKNKIKENLKQEFGSGTELTCVKKIAKSLEIAIPTDLNDRELTICLENILKDYPDIRARDFMNKLGNIKKNAITYYKENPNELIIWLYENQGEMRFDAANRFYLILTDVNNPFDSWKLKRNRKLLQEQINKKLDSLICKESNKIKFHWNKDGKDYECYSDILFISNELENDMLMVAEDNNFKI